MLRFVVILLYVLLLPCSVFSRNEPQYDIAYIWDRNLETVLDYQQQLEELLSPEDFQRLRIVGRTGGEYGLIYDLNGTALSSAQLMVLHSEMLRKADLSECCAIEDKGYYQLYNVSYGLGPNLDVLKKMYGTIYNYLGQEVGKNLVIEQVDEQNYTLIYRRRGDRASSLAVAKKHARLLQKKKITTTIIVENNNPVIFGESSHLDDPAPLEPAPEAPAVAEETPDNKEQEKAPDLTRVSPRAVKKTLAPVALVHSGNHEVERAITELIKELRRKGELSGDESTGWMVYDLTKNENLVEINADQVFQAASMIKPFVALAFFHQVSEGSLTYGPQSRRNMEAMIQHSNNGSTNWIMKRAGGPERCQEILQKHYGDIFKNTVIQEYIPPGGKTYKNSAIPSDYIRFLLALWNDELPYSKEIRRVMSLPGRDRLYDGTPIPRGTTVYNKTGSTALLCGDMGILVPRDKNGRRYPYALVGIIERTSRPKDYGHWMLTRGNVIRKVSTLVYEEMKKQYHLM